MKLAAILKLKKVRTEAKPIYIINISYISLIYIFIYNYICHILIRSGKRIHLIFCFCLDKQGLLILNDACHGNKEISIFAVTITASQKIQIFWTHFMSAFCYDERPKKISE